MYTEINFTAQLYVYTYTYLVWIILWLPWLCLMIFCNHGNFGKWLLFLFLTPAAPYWITAPRNLVLSPGEDGSLICRANGNPKPSISWLSNGVPIASKIFNYLTGWWIRKYEQYHLKCICIYINEEHAFV